VDQPSHDAETVPLAKLCDALAPFAGELFALAGKDAVATQLHLHWTKLADLGSTLCYRITVVTVVRVQTGLRIERNLLKVLKGLAEYLDVSLGDLVEGIALHAFEGKAPFSPETLAKIEQLKDVYGVTLTAADAHQQTERDEP
jgi:hypothetical protein